MKRRHYDYQYFIYSGDMSRLFSLDEAAAHANVEKPAIEFWLSSGQLKLNPQGGLISESELRQVRTFAITRDVWELIENPNDWLKSPNPWLGGRTPQELLGGEDEELVVNILEGIKHGMVA